MKLIKSSIGALFRSMGLEIRKLRPPSGVEVSQPLTSLQQFLHQLKAVGFSPMEIYDVGANRGSWTRSVIQVFPDSFYLMIEPQEHLRAEIADLLGKPNVDVINCAVSDHSGKARFSREAWDVTSHLIDDEGTKSSNGTEQFIEIEVMKIEDLMARRGRVPDLIKIDAEGFDLQVLDGARGAFGTTELFLVEAAVCCPAIANDVCAVVNRMNEAGYSLAAITDINTYQWPPRDHSPGLQWLVDLAFLRKDGEILAAMQKPNRDQVRVVPW